MLPCDPALDLRAELVYILGDVRPGNALSPYPSPASAAEGALSVS